VKRMLLVLTLALVVGAMMSVSALPLFAQEGPREGQGAGFKAYEQREENARSERTPPPFGGSEPEAVFNACKGLDKTEGFGSPYECP
jgi:hypothetical protein